MKFEDARVAWVLPVFGLGGNVLYNKPLLEALAARCAAFRVFTAEFGGDPETLGFPVERQGVYRRLYRYERDSNLGVDGYAGGVSLVTPGLIPSLVRYRPDLLVLVEFSLLSLYAVLARCLLPGARVLLAVETRPRFAQSPWARLARLALRRFIVKRADIILTNNAEGEKYLSSALHAPAGRVITQPYLVSDMAHCCGAAGPDSGRRSTPGRGEPVRFLYVGQLLQRKGLQYALQSLVALLPEYAERFVFEVVGDGPFREELERQARNLGLCRQVRFHGRRPYATLWRWYRGADLFLFPTLGDYRALVPFEALSMGLPIVASVHDGGVSETVDPGRNGYSFDPRDPAALAEILTRLLEAPALLAEFGKRSLEMARAYTLESGTRSLAYGCQRALDSGRSTKGDAP